MAAALVLQVVHMEAARREGALAVRGLVASTLAVPEVQVVCYILANSFEPVDVHILVASYGYVLLFLVALFPAGA